MTNKSNNVYVYIGKTKDFFYNDILPDFTKLEIEKLKNKKSVEQKRAVFGLLHKAVKDVYGFEDDFKHLKKTENGKPISDKYFLSISHTEEVVAVALSNQNIGIDIEKSTSEKSLKFLNAITHEKEKGFGAEDFFSLWAKKEAYFKYCGEKQFIPKNIDTLSFSSYCREFEIENEKYCLAVVGNVSNENISINIL